MPYRVDDFRKTERIETLVNGIRQKAAHRWHIMEICGGQTHAIARYRLEDMLPDNIRLLHGPGCPVCVTPAGIIDHALEIALTPNVIFASFGDMARVPGTGSDLLHAKAQGADVRIFYSPLDAVDLAEAHPDREVVFFAIGFETTIPVHLAALIKARRKKLTNFSLLTSLFAVPPAVKMIAAQDDSRVDGFLTAGHVCAITGNEPYRQLALQYRRPMVVTGFEPADLLFGIYKCVRQLEEHVACVENAYKRAVPENGNMPARQLMEEMLEPVDCEWRGMGMIPAGGFVLRKTCEKYDASKKFPMQRKNLSGDADNRCIAGEIMKGNKQVAECPHFRKECSPSHPLGASMVSAEGVCSAYFRYGES